MISVDFSILMKPDMSKSHNLLKHLLTDDEGLTAEIYIDAVQTLIMEIGALILMGFSE